MEDVLVHVTEKSRNESLGTAGLKGTNAIFRNVSPSISLLYFLVLISYSEHFSKLILDQLSNPT